MPTIISGTGLLNPSSSILGNHGPGIPFVNTFKPRPDAGSQDNKFLVAINLDIRKLNSLINKFNISMLKDNKLQFLHEIYQHQAMINNKYPPTTMSKYPEYREEIHFKLYKKMKLHFAALGITSLKNALVVHLTPQKSNTDPSEIFSEMLANMAPEKTIKMARILEAGALFSRSAFRRLYRRQEEPEYSEYQHFLSQYSIEFLGGTNSKNYKLSSNTDNTSFVLKLGNQLNKPSSAEEKLRTHSLRGSLTTVYAERRAIFKDATGLTVSRTLSCTQFCPGGNLLNYARDYENNARIDTALSLFRQMAEILNKIQGEGCAFTDMKNENWLIDGDGKPLISDTKSFIFANAKGELSYQSMMDQWYEILATSYMKPPEFSTWMSKPFSVDKMHSFLLGKNLYQFLTKCSDRYLHLRNDEQQYDFSDAIFNGEQGNKLKELIKQMICTKPDIRISVNDVLSQLIHIEVAPTQRMCRNLLAEIQEHCFGEHDAKMDAFIKEQNLNIRNAIDIKAIKSIKDELTKIRDHLEQLSALELHTIIKDFRDQASFYTVGMNEKADRLEQAMICVSVLQRHAIITEKSPEAQQVRKQLASHRFFWNQGVEVNQDGTINEEYAANSYKAYREKCNSK